MKKIYLVGLPDDSLIKEIGYNDFSDCFGMTIERTDINISDVVNCFFTASPGFVTQLMKARDKIARLAGLKTGDDAKREKVTFEPGKEIGLFKMYNCNDREAIIGADDKHLNFRVSLYLNPGKTSTEILISTVVFFNNRWGRLYMRVIKPFHKMVVPGIIKNIHKTLLALPQKANADIA